MAVAFQKGVAFFSLEMSAEQLMMRLIVAESELDSRSVRNGDLTPEQWKHMETAIKQMCIRDSKQGKKQNQGLLAGRAG